MSEHLRLKRTVLEPDGIIIGATHKRNAQIQYHVHDDMELLWRIVGRQRAKPNLNNTFVS